MQTIKNFWKNFNFLGSTNSQKKQKVSKFLQKKSERGKCLET
jgi:hypothetical protein